MGKFKDIFSDMESDDANDQDAIEVYADSVRQALDLASKELGIDVDMLDYEILEKGTRGLFGTGRVPYRVLILPLVKASEQRDVDDIEKKLTSENIPGIVVEKKKDGNGEFRVRVTKSGIWLTVTPPLGRGTPVQINDINNKLFTLKISNADTGDIEKALKKASGKPFKIGEWVPNPANDGTMRIEISDDEIKAFAHFSPPRFAGRHMEFDEVIDSLRNAGVVIGIKEEQIKEYLEMMNYSKPLLAAEGEKPHHGKDAFIDYKVRIDNTDISFEEDESGKIDFKNRELLENVVVGQLLAAKVPAENGIEGRTLKNRILPAKSGKDNKLQHGKGTILSEDGTELTAEINGQIVYKNEKISVEPVYVVPGDVSLETGNIVFLGSVIVQGSVQDNFIVKAAGNIEVKGTVQKAFLEAEGDILVRQGIIGREEAKVESTGGSIFAKFIQNANVIADGDINVPEGIIHSNVDSGGNIISLGKRARIVGGRIRAGNSIFARYLGADVSTRTEIWVGINPKIMQQIIDIGKLKEGLENKINELKLNLRNLENQKKSGRLPKEKVQLLTDMQEQNQKASMRFDEVKAELDELNAYVGMLEHKGRVCAEKTMFAGVEINIKDKKFPVKDQYTRIKISLEGGDIKVSNYEAPDVSMTQNRIAGVTRKR